jgi:hypothetical protein
MHNLTQRPRDAESGPVSVACRKTVAWSFHWRKLPELAPGSVNGDVGGGTTAQMRARGWKKAK